MIETFCSGYALEALTDLGGLPGMRASIPPGTSPHA